jgi:hypothetical protein
MAFVLSGAVFSGSAFAAFRGRDGLLVLQPTRGSGLVLVGSHGGNVRRICTDASGCGTPVDPRWSPNGRELVFDDGHGSRQEIITAGGTCLWCLSAPALSPIGGSEPAFTSNGSGITFAGRRGTSSQGLWELGVGAAAPERRYSDPFTDAVSSSSATVAATRAGYVWVGDIGALRRLARGSSPSLSPGGTKVALTRGRWIYVVRVRGHESRRIALGGAPAFSPDGRSVAYIGAGGRVYVVSARGGHPRLVPGVRARAVDWQPLPSNEVTSCAEANGHIVATDGAETIRAASSASADHIGWNGCLTALGVPWHLNGSTEGDGYSTDLTDTALADPLAALNFYYSDKYGDQTDTIDVYDLRDGKLVSTNASPCPAEGTGCSVDSLQLNASGFTAWHATESVFYIPLTGISCPSTTVCVAVDAVGNVVTSTDPGAGEASAWTSATVDGSNPLTGVSCPTTTLCVAVDAAGNVVTSTDPTGGASAWQVAHVGMVLTGVSCTTTSLCVAVGLGGQAVTSTDPTGGAGAWTAADIDAGNSLTGISCPSSGLCVAVDAEGQILSSIDPSGGAAAWTSALIAGTPAFVGVSCPAVSLCVAAGNESNTTGVLPGSGFQGSHAIVSTDPTGGASAWSTANVGPGILPASSVACASVSLCVLSATGEAIVSTDPAGGQAGWPQTLAPSSFIGSSASGLSCPSAALCAGVTDEGAILTSTSPASATPDWMGATVEVPQCGGYTVCELEQIGAEDSQGMSVLDSIVTPDGGHELANLHLSGDELTWTDNGVPRSATLG